MKRLFCFLLVLAGTRSVGTGADARVAYRIDTVAGSGRMGDGGPAVLAQVGAIQGIALDRFGNLYLADTDNHRIRKINAGGIISTVAGTGAAGFSGDGGQAAKAQLNLPYGLATDSAGSLYIADLGNNRVRRVLPDGTITTIAGTGIKGSAGDGAAASAAQLFTPRNVAVDIAGNLYISEFEGHRVRRVSPDGKIATIAGTGGAGYRGDNGLAVSAQLNSPAGLALDRAGALYVADSQNNRIRKISGGFITSALGAGGGMQTPHAVAVDSAGIIYVADATSSLVYAYTAAGKRTQFAGGWVKDFQGDGGPASKAALSNVLEIASDPAGNIFLADNVRVRRVDPIGIIQTVAGDGYYHAVGDGAAATDALLHLPSAVALSSTGSLYIADTGTQRIRQVLPSQKISTLAGVGLPVWGIDQSQVPANTAGLNFPMGVGVDADGNLLIADTANHRVRKVWSDRLITTVVGTLEAGLSADYLLPALTQLSSPRGVCFDRAGVMYIADTGNHRVLRVAPGAPVESVAGNGSAGMAGDGGVARSAQLNQPNACALDSFNNLFVADTGNHRIRRVTAGLISTVAGTGEPGFAGDEGVAGSARLQSPRGLTVDDNGNIYVGDSGNHRVRLVTPDGVIHTIAGQGTGGFAGDGGPAAEALLNAPAGMVLDGSGALYFADTNNDRVRRLVPVTASGEAEILPVLSVANAASLQVGGVAPGEIVVISGVGIGPDNGLGSTFNSGMVPTELGGSEVRFDGTPAPLFYSQATQVNAQVPYTVTGKDTTHVEVFYQQKLVGAVDVAVVATAPGVYPSVMNQDGSANSTAVPAERGAMVTFYATGEGLTDGANVTGQTAQPPYPHPLLTLSVEIAGATAEIVDASSVLGVTGMLQVRVRVPAGILTGKVSLTFAVGGTAAPDIDIWVK